MLTKYVVGKDLHKYNFILPGAIGICRYSGLSGKVLMKRQFIVDIGNVEAVSKEFQQVPYVKAKHFEQIAFETGFIPFLKDIKKSFIKHFLSPTTKINKKDLLIIIEPKEPEWEE